jgi:hypothetical protein
MARGLATAAGRSVATALEQGMTNDPGNGHSVDALH